MKNKNKIIFNNLRMQRIIQRKTVQDSNVRYEFKTGSINGSFIMTALIFVMGIFYLYTINASAVKGYEIKDIEKEISELNKENKQLMIKKAELNSLYKIEKESEDLKMSAIEIQKVAFIDEESPVALK